MTGHQIILTFLTIGVALGGALRAGFRTAREFAYQIVILYILTLLSSLEGLSCDSGYKESWGDAGTGTALDLDVLVLICVMRDSWGGDAFPC